MARLPRALPVGEDRRLRRLSCVGKRARYYSTSVSALDEPMVDLSRRAKLFLILLPLLHTPSATAAEQVPAPLRGNSIVLHWSSMRTWKFTGGPKKGQLMQRGFSVSASLYASTQGRIFGRTERDGQDISNAVSGAIESAHGERWVFESGTLVGYFPYVRGVVRLQANFSDGYKTCSMNLTFGKLGGTEPLIAEGGLELVDYTVTSKSCSVQRGNVFGGSQ
jgi:hypothetical protein